MVAAVELRRLVCLVQEPLALAAPDVYGSATVQCTPDGVEQSVVGILIVHVGRSS